MPVLSRDVTTPVTELSASELADKTQSGELSCQEVVEAYITRVEAVNPSLNALVIPMFEEARERAITLDRTYARGERPGSLHGVPITIKEQYRVKGTQVTLGARDRIGNVYRTEGPLVRRLRDAGAVILGKTNLLQTMSGWESDNRVYGRTNNPWDLTRTSGGSSGGESAIVSARGSALGLAADFGGSIRIPAHFCGLHGLKPTSGRLSNDDFPPLLAVGNGQEVLIPQPGPIARTVADLCLAMKLLAETSLQPTCDLVAPVPWPDPQAVKVEALRVGMYTDNGYFPASPAVRRAVEDAATSLRSLGVRVEPVPPPDAREAARIFVGVASAGGGPFFKSLLGREKPLPQVAGLMRGAWTPPWQLRIVARLMAARGQRYLADVTRHMGACSAETYWALTRARNQLQARFAQTLDEGSFDAIITPPFALPAMNHGSSEHLFPAASYAFVYNVIGAPAGVVSTTKVTPGEESDRVVSRDLADITARAVEEKSTGLPIGVQVVARHWREDVVLAIMSALETHSRSMPDYPDSPWAPGASD